MILSILSISIAASLSLVLSRLFKMPVLLFYLISGALLGPLLFNILDERILHLSDMLRTLALTVILLRAGLKLDLKTLKQLGVKVIFLSFIPAWIEAIVVSVLSILFLGFDTFQAILLGVMIASVSPAVIVPAMIKLMKLNPNKKIFPLILSAASIEDAIMIVIFTSFIQSGSLTQTLLDLPIFILNGIVFGLIFGFITYPLMTYLNKTKMMIFSIIMVCISFILVSYHDILPFKLSGHISVFVWMMVLATKQKEKSHIIHDTLNPMWLILEIFLFMLLGASLRYDALQYVSVIMFLILLIALCVKVVVVFLMNWDMTLKERLFMSLSFTPKATVQATLAPIPLGMALTLGEPILVMGMLSIMMTAPLASIVIHRMKDRLYPPIS